jgi:hypothetical protein
VDAAHMQFDVNSNYYIKSSRFSFQNFSACHLLPTKLYFPACSVFYYAVESFMLFITE